MAPVAREHFDIGIVVPLDEELDAVFERFSPKRNLLDEDNGILVYEVEAGREGITIVVCKMPDWGQLNASTTTTYLLGRFSIGLICVIGIAGALSDDVGIGDVVFSHTVYDLTQKSKIEQKRGGEPKTKYVPSPYQTPNRFAQKLSLFRTLPDFEPLREKWKKDCDAFKNQFGLNALRSPQVFGGTIISASVGQSSRYKDEVKEIDRKSLALETESGGVFASAALVDAPVLVVRGVCDPADEDKKQVETASSGAYRKIAAHNAACFLYHQLSNSYFVNSIQQRRLGIPNEVATKAADQQSLEVLLTQLSNEIDAELSALSPEYKAKPRGYVLPPPRLITDDLGDEFIAQQERRRIGPAEALDEGRLIHVSVPSSFPDDGMPWALANALLRDDLRETKIVPLVVSGASIKPPNNEPFKVAGHSWLKTKYQALNVKPVFIIHGFDYNSTSRRRFLENEIDAHPAASFIFCEREHVDFDFSENMLQHHKVAALRLCDPSFLSIANFFQKNYSKDAAEAESIAYKVVKVFHDFDLLAHPTYFAAITEDAIANLLQANRRAELIQLAVDGFLTFLVAGDPAKIQISRSTRKKVLTELARMICIEKRAPSRTEFYERVAEIARNFDLDIVPKQFVDEFFERSLLIEADDRIDFCLPFMRDYLVAEYLSSRPDEARQYFDIFADNFDILAFELYSELAEAPPSGAPPIIADINKGLADAAREIEAACPEEASALQADLDVRLLTGRGRLNRSRMNVRRFISDVEGGNLGGDKERFLDLTRDMAALARKRRDAELLNSASTDDTPEIASERAAVVVGGTLTLRRYAEIQRLWSIATIALNAGAEQIPASDKREIVSRIVDIALMLSAIETQRRAKVDFSAVKKQAKEQKSFVDFVDSLESDEDRQKLLKFVDEFFLILRPLFIMSPTLNRLGFLADRASHKVLGRSIRKAAVADGLRECLKGAWLVDVDVPSGCDAISNSLKGKEVSPFLREIIAIHLLNRIYWAKWGRRDRDEIVRTVNRVLPHLRIDQRNFDALLEKPSTD